MSEKLFLKCSLIIPQIASLFRIFIAYWNKLWSLVFWINHIDHNEISTKSPWLWISNASSDSNNSSSFPTQYIKWVVALAMAGALEWDDLFMVPSILSHCIIPSYLTLYAANTTKKIAHELLWIMYLLLRAWIFLVFVYFFHNCRRSSWLWNIFLSSKISQRYKKRIIKIKQRI